MNLFLCGAFRRMDNHFAIPLDGDGQFSPLGGPFNRVC
jgi:hypothetical protein